MSFDLNNPDILKICIGEIDVESFGMHEIRVPDKYKITQEQMFVNLVSSMKCEYLPYCVGRLKLSENT